MSRSVIHPCPQSKAEAYQRVEAILESGPFVTGTRAFTKSGEPGIGISQIGPR